MKYLKNSFIYNMNEIQFQSVKYSGENVNNVNYTNNNKYEYKYK